MCSYNDNCSALEYWPQKHTTLLTHYKHVHVNTQCITEFSACTSTVVVILQWNSDLPDRGLGLTILVLLSYSQPFSTATGEGRKSGHTHIKGTPSPFKYMYQSVQTDLLITKSAWRGHFLEHKHVGTGGAHTAPFSRLHTEQTEGQEFFWRRVPMRIALSNVLEWHNNC